MSENKNVNESGNEMSESTQSLLKDFMQPTENKTTVNAESFLNSNVNNKTDPVIIEPEPVSNASIAKDKKSLSPEVQSELYISIADTTQTLVFTSINRRKMKRRLAEKFERAEKIYHEIDTGREQVQNLNEDDYALYIRIKSLMEVENNIPFSADEYDKVKKPLSMVIKEAGYDLPPGMALTLVSIELMAPRFIDAIFE